MGQRVLILFLVIAERVVIVKIGRPMTTARRFFLVGMAGLEPTTT